MLVDSHCHLNMKGLYEDVDNVIQRARDAGVLTLQTICTKLSEFPDILEIVKKNENVYCSVGIHPHEAEHYPDVTSSKIIELANSHKKVIGIGETGLDYYYEHSDRKIQQKLFEEHIKASQETKKPIIVHSRDAEEDTISILKSGMDEKEYPGLIHCFSAGMDLAKKSLDLGLHISIAGIVTFKNAEELREVAAYVPLEKLLIETDSPYLAPIPMRGKTNEPAFVEHVAKKIAEVKGISFEEVAKVTTQNFYELFGVS